MHPVTQRLYEAAKSLRNISGQSAVARAMNESPQTVKNWEARGVSKAGILRAAEILGVRTAWLMTGEGAMTGNEVAVLPSLDLCNSDSIRIPVLANSGAMGSGSEMLDGDYVVGDLALSQHWINRYIKPANIRELRFMHARGESMAPTFSDGDVLLVDAGAKDPASHEGVYVLEVHGKVYIKRVRMRMNGRLEVSSDNPTIKTVDELNGDHEVRVLGRVVWAWNGRKL